MIGNGGLLTASNFRPKTLLLGLLIGSLFGLGAAAEPPLAYEQRRIGIDGGSHTVVVPEGYTLEALATGLGAPRMLTFAANGDLFAGSRSGRVYRFPSPYTHPEVVVELDGYPHAVAFRPGEILIALTNGVYRAAYEPGQRTLSANEISLLAALPSGGGHNSRTVAVGPDGRVYASLGISGNCSDEYLDASYPFERRRGGVFLLVEREGTKPFWQPYASGLRNPVGFAWHPGSAAMYATNNGPDHLGFDAPPEYFSRLVQGSFHGMPWFQSDGRNVQRDNCIGSPPPRPESEVSLPEAVFPPRNAPLGTAFLPLDPAFGALAGHAVVALHGSWATRGFGGGRGDPASRRPPKLALVRFDHERALGVEDLVTGFQLDSGLRWARPAGVAAGPDGAIYFTSDAGAEGLFRLRRRGEGEP